MLNIKTSKRTIRANIEELAGYKRRANDLSPVYYQYIRPKIVATLKGYPIPVRTGRLRRSFVSPGSSNQHISIVSKNEFVFGSAVPYARYIEKRVPIIGRLANNTKLRQDIGMIIQKYIGGKKRGR